MGDARPLSGVSPPRTGSGHQVDGGTSKRGDQPLDDSACVVVDNINGNGGTKPSQRARQVPRSCGILVGRANKKTCA
jgi:hypothetical protein